MRKEKQIFIRVYFIMLSFHCSLIFYCKKSNHLDQIHFKTFSEITPKIPKILDEIWSKWQYFTGVDKHKINNSFLSYYLYLPHFLHFMKWLVETHRKGWPDQIKTSSNKWGHYECLFSNFFCLQDHHHHHVVPPAQISLTISRHFPLLFIASGRSSRLHPVSSHSCCM